MELSKEKEKLHRYIDEYGISDERTIKQSKKIDKLIIKEQLKRLDEVIENKNKRTIA